MEIPSLVLKQLYNFNSLKNTDGGVQFTLKNRLSDAKLTKVVAVKLAGNNIDLADISLLVDEAKITAAALSASQAVDFPLRKTVHLVCAVPHLKPGKYDIEITVETEPFGLLVLSIKDGISDAGLAYFQSAYPTENFTKEDIFYYIYGLLHSDDYREKYADNLSKQLPRIPCVKTFADFRA